ncbi:MAG: hypothetical protein R6V85_18265 [Polyangia bacterium]
MPDHNLFDELLKRGGELSDVLRGKLKQLADTVTDLTRRKRVVVGSYAGSPPDLEGMEMAVPLSGAGPASAAVLATGYKVDKDGEKTPIAVRGTVKDERHVDFEAWDKDGEAYDPQSWKEIAIDYAVIDR